MEGCLQNEILTIRTPGHVLWTLQLPSDLSTHDGRHLYCSNNERMVDHLHGRYADPR